MKEAWPLCFGPSLCHGIETIGLTKELAMHLRSLSPVSACYRKRSAYMSGFTCGEETVVAVATSVVVIL